ncbi:DUF2937 family protein [Aestuariicoccus sp. MJ-SS9]|uniref:DUF2937 family protein n=1 Tax=Aestuariicoccus sp. MJ-SS9 TaxID=3079855 RepID=UPI0029145077|nr:DUF2937 family protein [Aestuariicoccus sp. MJ-SS9]MDU8912361.1 DUF2937 family protein [Aestuariicoccus sp. MJ-SS9]
MTLRTIALAGGLAGAAGLSQFPEFSQQYTQRLGGAVDELQRVVTRFDADAAATGLDRAGALTDLSTGGAFGAQRAATMRETVARYERLSADLAALERAGPFTRARLAGHLRDPEIAARAWEAYRPAVPATFEGAVFGGTGFVLGWLAAGALLRLLRRMTGLGRKRSERVI